MRILVTGARGQLGTDLMEELSRRGHEAIGADLPEMDITVEASVKAFFDASNPEAVIHCAAYTATDRAEQEIEICRKVNALGTRILAQECAAREIKMLYISTDYVFDGEGEIPFAVDAPAAPLSVYGQTKYEGEVAVRELVEHYFIVRISWVFGLHGKNFVKTMLRLGKENPRVFAVSDQVGSPTYTRDLSCLLAEMIVTDRYGTYHATNEGFCSWYEFVLEIFSQAGYKTEVTPVDSDYFKSAIKRPANSRMDKSKLDENGFSRLPTWQDAVARYLEELKQEEGAQA